MRRFQWTLRRVYSRISGYFLSVTFGKFHIVRPALLLIPTVNLVDKTHLRSGRMAVRSASASLRIVAKRFRNETVPSAVRAMSAPYRHPHYAESSSSHNRQWHEQAAYPDRGYQQDYAYDAYPREYERDYYAAYPPAHGEYEQRGYNGAQGYGWHDDYAHDQARRYDAAWGSDAYDAQGYGHHMQQSYQPPQLPYEAHGWQPHAPAQYPSNEVWSNAQAVPKHVEGAPAAPKKMRDAAAPPHSSTTFAQEPDWQGPYASAQPYNYNGIQQQQQRDYHSHAPSAGSSRFQPYIRSSPSAPGTPTHPSMYRPPPMQRLPPAIRAAPRPAYLEQAKKPSRELSDDEARDRKLLVVLDLNGTLVFRAKSGNGRAMDSVRAVPRPFLLCFLQYCLGTSTDTTPKGKQVDAANRPHGSHFWQPAADADATLYEPCSAGRAEVIVWSSAQPVNVDSMVRASFDASIRSQVLRVWARDTLVPHRFYQGKAESIKDLEIVWAELNAFTNDEPSLGRLIAQARDQADQARPDDVPPPSVPTAPKADKKYRGKKNKEKNKLKAQQLKQQHVSAALEAAQAAEEWGPWSAQNTVLVDDSVAKARLQPYNHLLIPEFGKRTREDEEVYPPAAGRRGR